MKVYVRCPYCQKKLKIITASHLKLHNKTISDLKKEFKNVNVVSDYARLILIKNKEKGSKRTKSINYIKEYLYNNKISYEILSTYYINSRKKLLWKCEFGHLFQMTWDSFRSGARCPTCFGTPKKTKKEILDFFDNIGYIWISGNYKHIYSKLTVKCPNNHISKIRFDQLQAGHRCHECHNQWKKIYFSGNGNPNWRGGISYEPYCSDWTSEYKDFIKERDGYKCLNPCCKSLNKTNLVVHHVDYNKKNCDLSNLITICNTCNTEANFNRKWHKCWYSAIIYRRYSYER